MLNLLESITLMRTRSNSKSKRIVTWRSSREVRPSTCAGERHGLAAGTQSPRRDRRGPPARHRRAAEIHVHDPVPVAVDAADLRAAAEIGLDLVDAGAVGPEAMRSWCSFSRLLPGT